MEYEKKVWAVGLCVGGRRGKKFKIEINSSIWREEYRMPGERPHQKIMFERIFFFWYWGGD